MIENRIWEQKDREQNAQVEARRFLMAQVDAGRGQQMRDAETLFLAEKEADFLEIENLNVQQNQLNEDDDAKDFAHGQAHLVNQKAIRDQITQNSNRRAHEQQRDYLDAKMQSKTEFEHERDVAAQGGQVNTHHPLSSTNWYS